MNTLLLIFLAALSSYGCEILTERHPSDINIDFDEVFDLRSQKLVKSEITIIDNLIIDVAYYEYVGEDVANGKLALYLVPKIEHLNWTKQITHQSSEACLDANKNQLYHIICELNELYSNDWKRTNNMFDMYIFHIPNSSLKGPFSETSESGSTTYYATRKDSPIDVYSYNFARREWTFLEQRINSKGPRAFGYYYLAEKLSDRH